MADNIESLRDEVKCCLDLSQVKRLQEFFDDRYVIDMICVGLSTSKDLVSLINKNAFEGNWDVVARSAHDLKSNAGQIGALGIGALASRVEGKCLVQGYDEVLALVPKLTKLMTDIESQISRTALQTYLDHLQS